MKLSDALQGFYLHMQSSGNSPNTIDNYKNFLGDPPRKPKPITLLLRLGDVEVTDITSEQLVKYMAWLATEYKPVRVNGRGGASGFCILV